MQYLTQDVEFLPTENEITIVFTVIVRQTNNIIGLEDNSKKLVPMDLG